MSELLNSLRAIVGENYVHTSAGPQSTDLTAYEQDWRKRVRGVALAVVRPANTEQVAQIVKACATAKVAIVPQGGNTGLSVGSVPDASGQQIVLSLNRMNQVLSIDAANATITVEAGCILQNVQNAALTEGFLFPLSLAAEGSCTIGGNLGTNAGGTGVLRYGNSRDLCLGLEVVTAQGDIWNGLSGLRKDNTGYDLIDLFVGSEGTLGIITAATLKLYPLPIASMTAWVAVESLENAVELLGLAQKHLRAGLTGFEVMSQMALSLVTKHFPQQRVPFAQTSPFCVLLEHSGADSEATARVQFESLLERAFESGLATDAVVAENLTQAKQLWHIRESIPMGQAEEGLNIKHDISVPISRIAEFCKHTDLLLCQAIEGVRLVNFGHLGDGNLHYNVQAPLGQEALVFLKNNEATVNQIVYDSVHLHGGSISAEHGIGSLKRDTLEKYKSAVALNLMRSIKQALDPLGTLNPGRVVQVPAK